jgi:hypothetical protein
VGILEELDLSMSVRLFILQLFLFENTHTQTSFSAMLSFDSRFCFYSCGNSIFVTPVSHLHFQHHEQQQQQPSEILRELTIRYVILELLFF